MPTYQYTCNDCGHFCEVFQSFSEDSLTVCPECGGHLRKVFNAVGVVFKGSGFYRNDSRGKTSTSEPAASAAHAGSSGSSSGSNGSSSPSSTPASTSSKSGTSESAAS